jgi:hypothetical protein
MGMKMVFAGYGFEKSSLESSLDFGLCATRKLKDN